MIITKSISRFARNTLDCLQYVRMLKDIDAKGEVLLTILSRTCPGQVLLLSENTRWGITLRFQQGKVRVNHKKFMGYDKDETGELIINEQKATHMWRVINEYLNGSKGLKKIEEGLEADVILTATGKKVWSRRSKKCCRTKSLRGTRYCKDNHR